MSVTNELERPSTEGDFEAMCHALYSKMWNDPSCSLVGGIGQGQFGVDIIGFDGERTVGIQCKHYVKTPFTFATVTKDVEKADAAGLEIDHLIFATTASSKSGVVKDVHKLSANRRKQGQFTVSVAFWNDLTSHLRVHPEVGRTFVPNFPGATLLQIQETTASHLDLYERGHESQAQFQAAALELGGRQEELLNLLVARSSAPEASGAEEDPRLVASLDFIRDKVRAGKSQEALSVLSSLGDPADFPDKFSRFRWHTNHAAALLLEGAADEAADEFLVAFELAPENGTAHANRVHAFLIKRQEDVALQACEEALRLFPESVLLWSLEVSARSTLGQSPADERVPSQLKEEPDLLFARANAQAKAGNYADAIALLTQCLDLDGGASSTKRAYLAIALSWAAGDELLARYGQLSREQRAALVDAVSRLEPFEQNFLETQSDHVSLEVATNMVLALDILGENERASNAATVALARHPLAEGPLLIKLSELERRDDLSAIHALTDKHLAKLPPSILGMLGQVAANSGDTARIGLLQTAAAAAGMEGDGLAQLEILALYAEWVAGHKDASLQKTEAYLEAHPDSIFAATLLGGMARQHGLGEYALSQALLAEGALSDASPTRDVLQVANLLYDLERYHETSRLFERLVQVPGPDELTRRLLISLVESGQRRRAQDLLDQLGKEIRELPAFRRIEINLARVKGDWSSMADLLGQELELEPKDCRAAVAYVGALYRSGGSNRQRLVDYLATDPVFADGPPEHEFEFAKYQQNHGFVSGALYRMYRLYRSNASSAKVASFFLSQALLGAGAKQFEAPGVAGPGSVVGLEGDAGPLTVAIDFENDFPGDGWPELVSPTSALANKLSGHKTGDVVELPEGCSSQSGKVTSISSLYAFAVRRAQEQVGSSAVRAGPLWSIPVLGEDGKVNKDVLLRMMKQRSDYVRKMFASYRERRVPIAMLAEALDSDPVTLLAEWPRDEASLFVGIGASEEREAAINLLREKKRRYVLDLLTIAELVRWGCFDAVVPILGAPLVPQTVREELLLVLQFAEQARPSATAGEKDGQLVVVETPASHYEAREAFLREILRCIDQYCEVVPVLGPTELTETHHALAEGLDAGTLDVLYLCIEQDAVLVSEDGGLRLWAAEVGIRVSMGIQPVLMEARDRGLLAHSKYSEAIVGKICAGHDFVSVSAEDLLKIALETPDKISEEIKRVFESFHKPTLELESGLMVCGAFTQLAIAQLPVDIAAAYGRLALNALLYGRGEYDFEIRHVIANSVKRELKELDPPLSDTARRRLDELLVVPARPTRGRKLSPLAASIRAILHGG